MKQRPLYNILLLLILAFNSWDCDLMSNHDDNDRGEGADSYTKVSTINRSTGFYTVVRKDAFIMYPQFALNGSYVVYREEWHYEVVNGTPRNIATPALKMAKADGTKDTILISGQVRDIPAISVDGSRAAVMINNTSGSGFTLSVVDLNTRIVTQVKSFTSTSKAGMPCFTSDGFKVIYSDTSSNSKLIAVTIATGSEQTIRSSDSVFYQYPMPVPTKGKVLYAETPRNSSKSRLYLMDDNGSNNIYLDSLRGINPYFLPIVWTNGDVIGYNGFKEIGFAFINIDGTGKQQCPYPYVINDFISTSQEILIHSMGRLGMFDRNTSSYTQLPYNSSLVAKYSSSKNVFLVDTSYSLTIYYN